MKEKPSTLIGVVMGIQFWEDPIHGDEAPLLAKIGGKWTRSYWYELPTMEEALEWEAEILGATSYSPTGSKA